MNDIELVSLLSVAMSLFNLYLLRELSKAQKVVSMSYEVLVSIAKKEAELDYVNGEIRVVKAAKP